MATCRLPGDGFKAALLYLVIREFGSERRANIEASIAKGDDFLVSAGGVDFRFAPGEMRLALATAYLGAPGSRR
jgi:hypothetical protein